MIQTQGDPIGGFIVEMRDAEHYITHSVIAADVEAAEAAAMTAWRKVKGEVEPAPPPAPVVPAA